MLIYMPESDGKKKKVRKVRIDHRLGDTQAKTRYVRPDKRQSDVAESLTEKRQKGGSSWSRRSWSGQTWWETSEHGERLR